VGLRRLRVQHSAQVAAMAPPLQVDLTREEDEGGVGGPIELGSPY